MTREQLIKAFEGIMLKHESKVALKPELYIPIFNKKDLATALVDSIGIDERKLERILSETHDCVYCDMCMSMVEAISTSDILKVKK